MGADFKIFIVLEIHKNQEYYECYKLHSESGYFINDKKPTSINECSCCGFSADSEDEFYYAYPCDSLSTLLYNKNYGGWINSDTFPNLETYPKEHNPWNYPEYVKKLYEKILKGYNMDKVTEIIVRKYREIT